jgi:S1-C subfamily serine protease
VLFFFSGLHADYHRPTDTWDKIDPQQASLLLDFIAEVATRLSDAPDRPKYVKIAPPRPAGGGGGYGAWFGSMPDFAEVPNGFRFADVMPDSPAMKAGLKAGDVLFEFDGHPIANLYDFTAALRTKKPGDTVPVKVHRGAQVVEANVTLENRR